MRTAFLALTIVFAFAMVLRADDAKDLNDTWKPTEGSKYQTKVKGKDESGTFKFDAAKTPKTMDIMVGDGPNKDKTLLTIYDLTGDTLKVCYSLDGKTRPDKFESTGENKYLLIVYKRKK